MRGQIFLKFILDFLKQKPDEIAVEYKLYLGSHRIHKKTVRGIKRTLKYDVKYDLFLSKILSFMRASCYNVLGNIVVERVTLFCPGNYFVIVF